MEKNRSAIIAFYIVLSLVVVLTSLPSVNIQLLGYGLTILALIFAYAARSHWPKNESFEENHSTFIIRTIWIYSTFVAIGSAISLYLLWTNGDRSALDTFMNSVMDGLMPTEEDMNTVVQKYVADNMGLIVKLSVLFMGPAQLYLVWRIYKGGERAFKNYRIAYPKKWF